MSSEAALIQEIQRLSGKHKWYKVNPNSFSLKGAIDRHKLQLPKPPCEPRLHQSRNVYVNPATANKTYVNPAIANKDGPAISSGNSSREPPLNASRELVIDGVAFQSSNRKLTRKDLFTKTHESLVPSGHPSTSNLPPAPHVARPRAPDVRKYGNVIPPNRVHKPKYSVGKRLGGRNNMVLDNIKGTRSGHMSKRRKLDRQCRFFTMTGVCQRGLTCPYQHDPEKIAICPLFLTHACPNSASTCQLSHKPTPSRVPFCHHFANHGRCTRDDCPYPHVRVGPRNGVCRDFAVVGYCDKGIDCDNQHVRECPDFAEKGICPNPVCKLPHVIRANRGRATSNIKAQPRTSPTISGQHQPLIVQKDEYSISSTLTEPSTTPSAGAVDLGATEEYISLTFEESDDDEDGDSEGEEEDGEDRDAEGTAREQFTSHVIVD